VQVLDCNSEPSHPEEQQLNVPENLVNAKDESWAHKAYAELTEEGAAVRLQRCMRGMMDRSFFRKYAKVQYARKQQEDFKEQRIRQRNLQLEESRKKEIAVKIPNIEPDGYLSAASMHRIQERGEALEKSDVVRKAKRIVTKKFASIDVIAPSNDFIWNMGQVRQIKWKMLGNIQVDRVGIYLYLDGEPIRTIVKAVPNVGKYIFTMPELYEPHDSYQVLVIAEEPKLPECHAFSSPFTLALPKVGQLAKVPPAIPTVSITFPVRSGWCWPTGSSYVLAWRSSGVVQNVQIDMLRHGEVAFRIAAGLLNSGAFPFAMPPDAPTGEGFQIRVRSVALKKACGISVPFSIIDRQVAQAVPRRVPVEKVRKITAVKDESSRLLAPLQPPVSLRHTWSAVDAREETLSPNLSMDMRAQTVAGREHEHTGGWSPSRPRGQLHRTPDLSASADMDVSAGDGQAPDATARSAVLHGGGTGRSAAGGGSGNVLVPNGNLGTPLTANGGGMSMSNPAGHRAIDIDMHQRPSHFTHDAEDDKIAIETVGEPDFETVYNRLRAKYTVKERDTGMWIKPEIERFAGKGKEILRPSAGTQVLRSHLVHCPVFWSVGSETFNGGMGASCTLPAPLPLNAPLPLKYLTVQAWRACEQHMMARSLSATPHLSDVNLPGLTSTSSTVTRKGDYLCAAGPELKILTFGCLPPCHRR